MKEVAIYSVHVPVGGLVVIGLLLLLALLLFVPRLGVLACYDQDGPWVKLRVGPKYIRIYPLEKDPDKKKQRKKQAQAEKKARKAEKQAAREKNHPAPPPEKRTLGGILALVWDLVPVVRETVSRFRRKLQIDDLVIEVVWAREDPADTGIQYGYGWAALEGLVTFLERNFVIKRRETALRVDFLSEEPRVYIRAGLSMTPAQLLAIGLGAAGRGGKVLWRHRRTVKPPRKNGKPEE